MQTSPPPPPRQPRAGFPSFEEKLENEEEVLDTFVSALSKGHLEPEIWGELHVAAVRHDRVSELAFAYESIAQGRKLRTLAPQVQAELFFRAAVFFGDVLGDDFGATTYLEKALAAHPAHAGAFEKIDAQLTKQGDDKKLADLAVQTAAHRSKAEQLTILRRAAALYERAGLEDKGIETYQHLVRLDPSDAELRAELEARFVRANRFRDVARMFEQALALEPAPSASEAAVLRAKLIDVFAHALKEPERAMPHVEALLEIDPTHAEARRVATRLLESKGLAARAAAALAPGAATTEERGRLYAVELENTRGPRRRDVLRRVGVMKQDELGDLAGAFEAFEQALGIDPADDELRARYATLGSELKGPLEVARTFARVSTVAKDAAVRSRITAEMGALLLRGGDVKRARTTLAGILSAPNADEGAVLVAARALAEVFENDSDPRNLLEVLSRVGELSPDEEERQRTNERVAEVAQASGDVERAIAAYRRLVDSPARAKALEALEPLYEERGEWPELSFVLEERARDIEDRRKARELSFRAADILATKTGDVQSASEAFRQMVESYGSARDIYAAWTPLLEAERRWPELATALTNDAALAPDDEKPAILARLGNVYLARIKDVPAAIDAFRRALAGDREEKTSRAALERLLAAGDHRLDAANVLEPIVRQDEGDAGLLRVLDVKATLEASLEARLHALEEAADFAAVHSREKALELVGRGLAEAVANGADVASWLGRFDLFAADADRRKRAAILGKALGDRPVDSDALVELARRLGDEHAAAGDVAAALASYRGALAYRPSSAELVTRVDELLREQGNPEERVALYRSALEQGPDPARRRQLLHAIGAVERSELSNPDGAILAYKRALKEDDADMGAFQALVELYAETEAWEELTAILEERLPRASSPEQARAVRAQLADVCASHGDREAASSHARVLLADELGATELDLLERVAARLDDASLLRATLERRVRDASDPKEQTACLGRLATLAERAQDLPLAVERLRQAADIARGAGDDGEAIAFYTRLRGVAPRDEEATRALVQLLEQAEDWGSVPLLYAVLLDVTEAGQDKVQLLRRLAHVFADKLSDAAHGFDAMATALSIAPAEVLPETEALALRAGKHHDFARTIDEIVRARELEDDLRTALGLSKARVLAADPAAVDDAAAAYRQVLESATDEHLASAIEGFEQLLHPHGAEGPRVADVRWLHHFRIGRAGVDDRARLTFAAAYEEENELHDAQAALRLYKQVLELDAENLEALAAVSRLSLAEGDVEGALEALSARRSVSDGEARTALDLQMAQILASTPGRAREALDRIRGVLEAAPHEPQAIELAAKLLRDPNVAAVAAEVLEKSIDAVEAPALRADILRRLLAHGEPRSEGRAAQYQRLLDLLDDLGEETESFAVVRAAARELPGRAELWDRAEAAARKLSDPDPLAHLYEAVLRGDLPREEASEVGQRAVAFYEEWFEDGGRVVGILERLLEIDETDTWAFDRVKLIFDAQERWDDLFALFDRTAANADRERKIELLEEAAQIAKDFAKNEKRAIGYFEQLLDLKPGNPRLEAALERLYERHGRHRELIQLLGTRVAALPHEEAQRERARIAGLWLSELSDASSAIIVLEDLIASRREGEDLGLDVVGLLERVLTVAPKTAEIHASVAPPPDGARRDSYFPLAQTRGLVRARAAARLLEFYAGPGHEADLARVLEIELESVTSSFERVKRHAQIAGLYIQLLDDERAMDHVEQLVLLEPGVATHRAELAALAGRTGLFERLASTLVAAADGDASSIASSIELLMEAATVTAERVGDSSRAVDLFFRVIGTAPIPDATLLAACRKIEPLLANAGRHAERLDVLERIAKLEESSDARSEALVQTARLAQELGDGDRAIWAWEGRLQIAPSDVEALDGLVVLLADAARFRPLIAVLRQRSELDAPLRSDEERRADRVHIAHIQAERLNEPDAAIETWRAIEAVFGETEETTRALGGLYRSTGHFDALAALLVKAAEHTESIPERVDVLRELGDVRREHLGDVTGAIASYEAALGYDPHCEGSRAGLRALLKRLEHRPDVVPVLLEAYEAGGDWQLVLDLTEHRLAVAKDVFAQIGVLAEAAQIVESRAEDAEAAFVLVRRALLLDPSNGTTLNELFRLAERTRDFRALADALREAIHQGGEASWVPVLRFRMAEVLEARLEDAPGALEAFQAVAAVAPSNLEATRAVIRVAGKIDRWESVARAVVEATQRVGALDPELVVVIEDAAARAGGWDEVTSAIATLVANRPGLDADVARDLEAAVATWHLYRRGDPDAAEAAFGRALAHDATSAEILGELTQLQRRAKGRPLVESLLRLSETRGGDLELLGEAADVASSSVGDRALSKSILATMRGLAVERWTGADASSDTSSYVERATRELVRIHGDEGDADEVVSLLLDTAKLPWPAPDARALRHEAARVAATKLPSSAKAVDIYLGLLEEDPLDGEATTELVAIYLAEGRATDLLALKRRLVGTRGDVDARLGLRLEVAELEDRLEGSERAVATLRENLSEVPRHAASVTRLVTLLARDASFEALAVLFGSQAELAEGDGDEASAADLHAQAADVLENKLGNVADAIAHLKRVVALEERAQALDALARLSTVTGEHEAAAGYLDRLRARSDERTRANVTLRLADALVAAGRRDDAKIRLAEEVATHSEADDVRVRLAKFYRAEQDFAALAKLLTEGAEHAPDKATRLARLTEAAELRRQKTNEPALAVPLLEQAVDLSPDDNALKLALADALGAAGSFDESRGILRALIDAFGGRRPKERAPVHYHLALLDLAVGDRARALVELDAATRIDPANPPILRTLAELARDDGQLERAERSYRALLTVLRRQEDVTEDAPVTRSEVMYELAQIATRQGELDRAKEILESAFELSGGNDVEARRLENALRNGGDHESLARALEARLARVPQTATSAELLAKVPDASDVFADLAHLYESALSRLDDALEIRLRAVALSPADDAAHAAADRLARLHGKAERYEERVRALAEAEASPALSAALFVRLGRMSEELSRDDHVAASLFERAREQQPESREILDALDRVYERIGDHEAQARVLGLRVALDAEQASASALYRLAQLRFRSNEVAAACDAFEQASAIEPDAEVAEQVLRSAAELHPENERVLDLYERLARGGGRERTLVDALVRKWQLPNATSEPMREAVEIALELGDGELSEQLLRRWLEGASDDAGRVWALSLLARIVEGKGHAREAVLLKREAAGLAEPDDARRLLFEVAQLATGPLDDLPLAAKTYEELREREPGDKDAWSPLLDLYRRLDDHEKLSALVADVASFCDDPSERSRLRFERVRLGMDKLGVSDEDTARELQEIVDEDGGADYAAEVLETIYERAGREDDLVGLLGRRLEAAKDRGEAQAVSGLSIRLGRFLEKRDPSEAQNVYYTALDWDAKAREILLALERIHQAQGQLDSFAEVMERRLPLEEGQAAEELALTLADLRQNQGEADAALRALELGFKATPSSRTLRSRLEALYREQLEYGKLADLFVRGAREDREPASKASKLRQAARVYREEIASPEDAARVLREAWEATPEDVVLIVELVDSLMAAGEFRAAEADLSTALGAVTDDHPQLQDLIGRRGTVRVRLGDMTGALADFETAVALGDSELRDTLIDHLGKMALAAAGRGDAKIWHGHRLRIAELKLVSGEVEEARNVLTELLKTDSKDKSTLRLIAYVDELEGRWDAASATYRRLVGLEEGEELVTAAIKLAETCEKAGRLADARGGLERARLAAPENELIRQHLGWLYERLGAFKELAEMTLEEARVAGDVAPRFEGLMRAGQLFLQQAHDPSNTSPLAGASAVPPLEEAHALRPADLDCVALLSDAYVAAGRIDEGSDILQRTIAGFKGRRARELSALYHRLARIADIGGDRAGELSHLTTALDMDSQNGVVASELAYLAMEQQSWDLAQRALRAVTMLKTAAPLPRALAYQHLGEIARHQGDLKRALVLLKRAVDDDPTLESARALLEQLQTQN